MPSWNAEQYLKFADERTRPCRDLTAAIRLDRPQRIIDLGCGPGNSTMVLAERWPQAAISGLDNATPMIAVAQQEQPQHCWVVRNIAEWAENDTARFDLVFSNAALQWVDDHARLFPQLIGHLASEGVLAIQIPADFAALPHRLMRELAPPGVQVKEWHSYPPAFYFDALSPYAKRVDVWVTEYQHVMPNADAIVEWYKGTGLRPFLEALPVESERERFLSDFRERLQHAYPPQANGQVLFPFRRLFIVAYL